MTDEQAIRDLVATWHRATAQGDLQTILSLMADDVIFLVTGQPPMRGKDAFAGGFKEVLKQGRIESSGEIQEMQVSGELAYCWTQLSVTMIPNDGPAMHRSGPTLTIFRKQQDGAWVLFRDANLLAADQNAAAK